MSKLDVIKGDLSEFRELRYTMLDTIFFCFSFSARVRESSLKI